MVRGPFLAHGHFVNGGFGVQLCPSVCLSVCRCVTQATRRYDSADDVKVFPMEFRKRQRARILTFSLSNMVKRTFCLLFMVCSHLWFPLTTSNSLKRFSFSSGEIACLIYFNKSLKTRSHCDRNGMLFINLVS